MQLSNHFTFDDLFKLALCVLHPKKKIFKGTTTGSNITLPNLSLSLLIITFILFIFIILQINRLAGILLESELNSDKRYQMFRDENGKTGGGGGGGVGRKLGKGEGRELEHELLFFTKLFLRSE